MLEITYLVRIEEMSTQACYRFNIGSIQGQNILVVNDSIKIQSIVDSSNPQQQPGLRREFNSTGKNALQQ
jgi:hypothetical protein